MVNYKCDFCGAYFDTPILTRHAEVDAVGVRRYTEEHCPLCGCDSFRDATVCPQCEGPMLAHGQLICGKCRQSLKERIFAFADGLTANEEQQLDEWMDGDTISNRRNWK